MKKYWRVITLVAAVVVILFTIPKLAEISMATGALRGVVGAEKQRAELSQKAGIHIAVGGFAFLAIVFAVFLRRKN